MLRLWLLRHAKSAWDDPSQNDFDRKLSPRGKRACRRLAQHLLARGVVPEAILCSPAARTRETYERLRRQLVVLPDPVYDATLYLAEPKVLLNAIHSTPARNRDLMLIGHNPGLEDLAAQLTGSASGDAQERLRQKYPTGGLSELTFPVKHWSEVAPRSGYLASFVTPAQLDAAADYED